MLRDTDKSAHSAYPLETVTLEPSAFCWRPYWSSRLESLWSLLRKFAHLNAINHYEIVKLYKCNDVSQEIQNRKWCLRVDLRHFGSLDPSKLSIILGISPDDLAEATVLPFVREHEADILTSNFLRFCPTCIRQGFHSPLHQLLFLPKCPAHGDWLEIRCTKCVTHPIPYKLPSISSKELSKCAHMVHGLNQLPRHANTSKFQKEAAKREMAFVAMAELLAKRVEINALEPLILLRGSRGGGQKYLTRHLKKLSGYWIQVFGAAPRKKSLNVFAAAGTHRRVVRHETSCTRETRSSFDSKAGLPWRKAAEAWDLELYRIYKAIRRHLTRYGLSHHRRCIVRDGKHLGWDRVILNLQGRICPIANALLLWRMFLEGVTDPYMLFQSHRRFREGAYYSRITWTPPSDTLPNWVLRRIFVLECIGLFHECLLLAKALYRRNTYSFQVRYIQGKRIPHWLIEEHDSGEVIMHWWISRSLSSLFSQNPLHFNSRRVESCPFDSLC